MTRLKPFESVIDVKRMTTVEASRTVPDESLDYVYVDARHDYCATYEDIDTWWPKLKPGGILAGHDYLYAEQERVQDWSLCENGTRHRGAVRGAVEDFAKRHGLSISATFRDPLVNSSWMTVKPYSYDYSSSITTNEPVETYPVTKIPSPENDVLDDYDHDSIGEYICGSQKKSGFDMSVSDDSPRVYDEAVRDTFSTIYKYRMVRSKFL
jgi:hypothetical protein